MNLYRNGVLVCSARLASESFASPAVGARLSLKLGRALVIASSDSFELHDENHILLITPTARPRADTEVIATVRAVFNKGRLLHR